MKFQTVNVIQSAVAWQIPNIPGFCSSFHILPKDCAQCPCPGIFLQHKFLPGIPPEIRTFLRHNPAAAESGQTPRQLRLPVRQKRRRPEPSAKRQTNGAIHPLHAPATFSAPMRQHHFLLPGKACFIIIFPPDIPRYYTKAKKIQQL